MGQKVSPVGIRLGITTESASVWYADKKHYADYLNTDMRVREFLKKKLAGSAISHIKIERPAKSAKVLIYSARPGTIIGKKGADVGTLQKEIAAMMGVPVHLTIEQVQKPELNAQLTADNIAQQLERRVMFRRVMKRAIQTAMRAGALGVKVCVGGRLGGAEIARSEWSKEGRIPLHTFRADIDYATARAQTTYGVIGVKVWIFKGEVIKKEQEAETTEEA